MSRRPMAAVKALVERGDELLALEIDVGGTMWTLPGGRVEYGEAPRDALEREVREEVSLEIDIGETVGMYHFFIGPENDGEQVVLTVFDTEDFEGMVDIESGQADEAITGYSWMEPGELVERELNDSLERLLRRHYGINP